MADGNKRGAIQFLRMEEVDMPDKNKDPLRPDPKKTPVRRPDKEASPEPRHVDPPPRDVREAPASNPNGDKKS